MSTVECNSCGEKVSPRLWHKNVNSLFINRSSQHICPICGVTMYTTGGGINIGVFSTFILAIILLFLYISADFGASGWIFILLIAGVWGAAMYKTSGSTEATDTNKEVETKNPWTD